MDVFINLGVFIIIKIVVFLKGLNKYICIYVV